MVSHLLFFLTHRWWKFFLLVSLGLVRTTPLSCAFNLGNPRHVRLLSLSIAEPVWFRGFSVRHYTSWGVAICYTPCNGCGFCFPRYEFWFNKFYTGRSRHDWNRWFQNLMQSYFVTLRVPCPASVILSLRVRCWSKLEVLIPCRRSILWRCTQMSHVWL